MGHQFLQWEGGDLPDVVEPDPGLSERKTAKDPLARQEILKLMLSVPSPLSNS